MAKTVCLLKNRGKSVWYSETKGSFFWKILQDLSALQQAEFEAHELRWQKTAFERQMHHLIEQASD